MNAMEIRVKCSGFHRVILLNDTPQNERGDI